MNKYAQVSFAILLLLPLCANATDITFTSSGSIVDGNVFDTVYVQNDGTVVNMSGGQIKNRLYSSDASTFNMSSGVINGSVFINNLSTFNISSGTINQTVDFVVMSSASANLSGGNITASRLKTYSGSVVNITGGNVSFGILDILGDGELNISGGLLNIDNTYIDYYYNPSTVTIFGYGFNYNPTERLLTGYLLDDNPFTIKQVSASEYTRFNLIPEPATLLLLSFGALALRRRR